MAVEIEGFESILTEMNPNKKILIFIRSQKSELQSSTGCI